MKSTFKVFDSDDFGANHVISDMCQSHDCRDILTSLHQANPNFKATLFAIPGEMTAELTAWAQMNSSWIELAVHGFFHQSNYECEKLSYDDFDFFMSEFKDILKHFVKGFRSPGWQTSPGVFQWLADNGYWISCQDYDLHKLPDNLPAFVNHNGEFKVHYNGKVSDVIPNSHHHCWDVGWNGVYEQFDQILELVKTTKEFKFMGEVINEIYPTLK